MLLKLQTAIADLLKTAFPALFTGAGAVAIGYAIDNWSFDALSVDPVAGEPGPEDAVDVLPFNPALPTGPHTLTRAPYPGPRRVYLRSAAGDMVALLPGELVWNPADTLKFTLQPRPGRDLAGFDHLEVQYGVVAAGTRLKTLHQITITLSAADSAKAEQGLVLALAALSLNREALRAKAAFAYQTVGYQAQGSLKSLSFVSGTSAQGSGAGAAKIDHKLILTAEVDLRVQRLLGADEGQPIVHILSPGKTPGTKSIDIDPAVQG
jgi:hypothetical protein